MNSTSQPAKTTQPAATAAPRPRVPSEQLLQGTPAVEIAHDGQLCLLRVTRENKVILTK
jgi:hemin uptake protein HemP